MRGLWIGALFSILLGACAGSESITCDDGSVCPSTLTCAPNGGCASLIQIASCESRADGDSCSTGAGQGICNNGICLGDQCGNGVLDEGEVCDIAIQDAVGTCRSDCRKLEVCGDGIVDDAEQCDDGNQNDADGCTAECVPTNWVGKTIVVGKSSPANVDLDQPHDMFVDGGGNVFIVDKLNNQIVRLNFADNSVQVVAGNGMPGFSGDGGAATAAQLNTPRGVFVDGLGDIYIADRGNNRVRRVDATNGVISTVAGGADSLPPAADGNIATDAKFDGVYSVFVLGNGDFYMAETASQALSVSGEGRVWLVDADTGTLTTVAGGGELEPDDADGGLATSARLGRPSSISVVGVGDDAELYIAEGDTNRIRHVDSSGIITTVAGGGNLDPADADGGAATSARLKNPSDIEVVGAGTNLEFYIADSGYSRIRHVDSSGIISTVAGGGELMPDLAGGGLATSASLLPTWGIAVAGTSEDAELYITARGDNRVRHVDSAGIITTVVGEGDESSRSDGGLATSAPLNSPRGIFVVGTGVDAELYFAESSSNRIRHVDSSGMIATVAGGGNLPPAEADGELATKARLVRPWDVFVVEIGAGRELYISDSVDHLIRHVDSDGIITTVAGGGSLAPEDADGGLATGARLFSPKGIFVAGTGDAAELYIADSNHERIRHVDSDGTISTVAGTGAAGFSGGDNGLATLARLNRPSGIFVTGTGDATELYIADTGNRRIRHVDLNGVITTVAGGGILAGADAENVSAKSADLRSPEGIDVVGTGETVELFIAEASGHRIRHVDSDGIITTVVGRGESGASGDGGLATSARLSSPYDVCVVSAGAQAELYLAEATGNRIRHVDSNGIITTVAGETFPIATGLLANGSVGIGTDPQSIALRDGKWLVAGGTSGTVQEIDLEEDSLDVVAGRFWQEEATADLARFGSSSFGSVNGIAYNDASKLIYLSETEGNRIHVVATDDQANGVFPERCKNLEDLQYLQAMALARP